MPVPDFSPGEVLTAAAMDRIGLWLVKTVTIGTGVSSVPVTGVFSSDYENYKILVSGGITNTPQGVQLQFGPSSVSGYNTSYNTVIVTAAYASPFGTTITGGASTSTYLFAGEGNTDNISIDLDVLAPNLAKFTTFQGFYVGGGIGGTSTGVHKQAEQYTDFTLITSGTMTGGTIRVYGYRN